MPRPTLLIAEPEPEQALSVRKLVLETGKFNVLTARASGWTITRTRSSPSLVAIRQIPQQPAHLTPHKSESRIMAYSIGS